MIEEQGCITNKRSKWTLYGSIHEFSSYKELLKALYEAQEGDSIELKINSPGGDVSVGMMIVQAIQETKAVVVCNVVYPSHSMGAIIALAGDYMIMQPHTFLMFHTYSSGTFGKSGDMIKDVQYTDESLKGMLDEIVKPFLTTAEIRNLHKGDDLYIKANDDTLSARLKRHFKYVPNSV